MRRIILGLIFACTLVAHGQTPWSTFLDPTRAVDWGSSAGFTIPSYTVNCATSVGTLATGTGAAAANATKIQNALNSCDATHNVVLIPAGTWYVTAISTGTQGKQVLRGAGANTSRINFTTGVGCTGGLPTGICMKDATGWYNGSTAVLPGGTNACNWTAGYTQNATSITLNSCGSAPPVNQTIILDQADDQADTGGVYVCDVNITNCGYESGTNNNGRFYGGKLHGQQQVTKVTAVSGTGPYTVTISPGVYFSNIASGNAPGAWWPGFVQNVGVENITLDASSLSGGATVGMYDCYQCWATGVRFLGSGRNAVDFYQSGDDVVRNNYFYGAQGSASESYSVEYDSASSTVVENNIFQQVTTPIIFGAGSGNVIDYNFNVDVNYSCGGGCPTYANGAYASHNAGNEMNLFEGNSFFGIWGDDAWGSSAQDTYFRNILQAYQNGKSASTFPIMMRSWVRGINVVGNVLGQTGYHTQYQAIATSTTGGTGAPAEDKSIYSIGWAGTGAVCSSGNVTQCDPKSGTTLMRWGNYDTVNAATQWNSTEAAPGAVTFMGANFSTSYFNTLAHTLPGSLYYSSTPSWWPSGKAFPPIGPDVASGNLGVCTGTYAGAQATSSSSCTGGSLTASWASHANAIPAEDCYLNTMHGPPDGTGSVLAFDPTACYASAPVTGPTFSPPAGTYTSAQSVTITPPSGDTCFYTVDGSTPSIAGTLFSSPISVTASGTIKTICAQVGQLYQDTNLTSANSKCGIASAHTYGSLSCQTAGGVGTINPSNVVWNFGSPMTEQTSTTSSTGTTQILYIFTKPSTACTNCTQLVQDKVVKVDKGPTFLLNNEMDSNVNMLATYNQFHTASLQCNQQSGILQWQYDNQQGSWHNFPTPITYGCPLSTTQQTEIRYGIHWTNGDTSCTGGFSCDSYDFLTICVGGTNGVGGSCQDFTFTGLTLPGYTEPTFSQSMVLQDQPDLTNTTTCGTSPCTTTRSVVHNNMTLAQYGTSVTGSAAYVINSAQAATPTFSPGTGTYTSTQTVTIATTTPSATLYYTTDGSTPTTSSTIYTAPISVSTTTTVKAIAAASGFTNSNVGSAVYTITPQAPTPTFSPAAGTYTSTQIVTISDTAPSPTIYYTLDGSTPTTSSAVYSGPLTISTTTTVKAIATAPGFTTSGVGTAAYTINIPVAATPTFSPGAGTYPTSQSITISDTTPSSTIYYTTDGSTPTVSSTQYTVPVTIAATTTVKAIAVAVGFTNSAVASGVYTISPGAPPSPPKLSGATKFSGVLKY